MSDFVTDGWPMYDPASPFTARPVAPASLRDFTYTRLRGAILACEIAPGELVSESGLVARFGLPKAAVRAALAKLEATGLVSASPRRGWRAAPLTAATIRALVAARRRLEPVIADVSPGVENLAALQAAAETAAAAHGPSACSTAHAADRQIMDRLAALAGNPFVERWLGELWDEAGRVLALCTAPPHVDRPHLIAALANRERAAARREIAAAIDRFERTAIALAPDRTGVIGHAPRPGAGAPPAGRSPASRRKSPDKRREKAQ